MCGAFSSHRGLTWAKREGSDRAVLCTAGYTFPQNNNYYNKSQELRAEKMYVTGGTGAETSPVPQLIRVDGKSARR